MTNQKIKDKVKELAGQDYESIIPRKSIHNTILDKGKNGIGDRFANKLFDYTCIYNNDIKTYSNIDDDNTYTQDIIYFMDNYSNQGKKSVIGIKIHREKETDNKNKHTINKTIKEEIVKEPCVFCGKKDDINCDHKNDHYNDSRVLNTKTQKKDDFQPVCTSCNLKKREIYKKESNSGYLFDPRNIPHMKPLLDMIQDDILYSEFGVEREFNPNDIENKVDTYWYDPVEFIKKIIRYLEY
jgi:hypothetical protein